MIDISLSINDALITVLVYIDKRLNEHELILNDYTTIKLSNNHYKFGAMHNF